MNDNRVVLTVDITSDDFIKVATEAGARARQTALAAGQPVVYLDTLGRLVEERPDGRLFEIRLDPNMPRESRRVVVRELTQTAA